MTTAQKIKRKREELGLSQEALAKRMGLKSKSSVSRIENSGDDITLKDVERIAEALGCSPLELMGWIYDPTDLPPHIQRYVHYFNLMSAKQRDAAEDYLKYLVSQNKKEE
jgi:transcriptional regulator with XRE-family HTH domain